MLLLTCCALPFSAATSAQAQDRAKPLIITGRLNDKEPFDKVRKQSHHKVHEVELKQGAVYLIELRSVDFEPILRLEDVGRQKPVEINGLSPDHLTGRIGHVAQRTGKHRLVVTSFSPHQTGEPVCQC